MRTLFLSMLDGLFTKENKENSECRSNKIFFTETDPKSNRTLIIEEDEYAVWTHMLSDNKEEVDFEGFLCTVVNPDTFYVDSEKVIKKDKPLPIAFANPYSFVKNLRKKDISVQWQKNCATILIKDKVYLIMDMNTRTAYSKALSTDCEFGKRLDSHTYTKF